MFLTLLIFAISDVSCFLFGNTVLYSNEDPLVILNATNFKPTIYNSNKAWIVEFYNSWCGHCQAFAPTWKQLANDTKRWKEVIDIAVIDCAVEANIETCRFYDILGYPTMKFFKPHSEEVNTGSMFSGKRDVASMREGMLDFLEELPSNSDLEPFRDKSIFSLWDTVPPQVNTLAVIVESDKSYIGREVILDSINLRSFVKVYRVLSSNEQFISSLNVNITTVPVMLIFTRAKNIPDKSIIGFRSDFGDYLEILAKANGFVAEDTIALSNQTLAKNSLTEGENVANIGIEQGNKYIQADYAYEQDLENALHYMFNHEVSMKKVIAGDKLSSLINWLGILFKHYPGRTEVKDVLEKLLEYITVKHEIKGEEFQKVYRELLDVNKNAIVSKEWTGCRGTQPHLRGYTCGLWTLFHSLTVSAYRMHDDVNFNKFEVLRAIRDYVATFFGCEDCAKHFAEMAVSLDNEVESKEDSVLWLWRAHNRVNIRIKGSASEDPGKPKVQFPSADLCANCKNGSNHWNRPEVLKFLISHYSSNIVHREYDSKSNSSNKLSEDATQANDDDNIDLHKRSLNGIQREKIKSDTRMNFTGWGFSTFDVSLCVFLYISSLFILLTGYFCIVAKKRSILPSFRRRTLQSKYFV